MTESGKKRKIGRKSYSTTMIIERRKKVSEKEITHWKGHIKHAKYKPPGTVMYRCFHLTSFLDTNRNYPYYEVHRLVDNDIMSTHLL